ncbi:MAG: hypothetical protein RSB25_21500, partial [Acinetobacter sp.]
AISPATRLSEQSHFIAEFLSYLAAKQRMEVSTVCHRHHSLPIDVMIQFDMNLSDKKPEYL